MIICIQRLKNYGNKSKTKINVTKTLVGRDQQAYFPLYNLYL